MEIEGLTIIDGNSGIPLFSKLETTIDDTLFSGFLTAIRNFTRELSLGGLSSFTTDEKIVYIVARKSVMVALIVAKQVPFEQIYSLAYTIGERFEEEYDLTSNIVETDEFKEFSSVLEQIIHERDIPFLIRVAKFAQKEFGGKLSLQPQLKNRLGDTHKIDLVLDRGIKKGGIVTKMARYVKSFSEEVTFVKVIDGTAGRGEIKDFLDLLTTYGRLHTSKDDEFPYFPAKAAVVARDYSPTVKEEMNKLPKHKNKLAIPGIHIAPDARMTASAKCFIELWKWHDDKYPELVQD
ncbi:MAG: hypothetical protein ACFFBD_12935 [Candidatus Hodarchaeota archaeon]